MGTDRIELPSGCRIDDPLDRMLQFCREEFPYYDGLPQGHPDRIEPLDVLATVSVNGLYSANAARVRAIHRGLASSCNATLADIDPNVGLLEVEDSLTSVRNLLHRAVSVPQVLIPVATKVLHRKRPKLIPMLDNVVLEHYLGNPLPPATQDKARATSVAIQALKVFRTDLAAVSPAIDSVIAGLVQEDCVLTRVRVLEVSLWTEAEDRGYYR
jgi:hypothetical protein